MTSRRNVKAQLKRARRATAPFAVIVGGEKVEGTLSAVPYMRWQTALTDNPPREGHVGDAGWGFNTSSFWGAALREGWTSPDMDDEDWDLFFDVAPVAEINRLGMEVFTLTMSPAELDVPKSSSTSPETTSPNSG